MVQACVILALRRSDDIGSQADMNLRHPGRTPNFCIFHSRAIGESTTDRLQELHCKLTLIMRIAILKPSTPWDKMCRRISTGPVADLRCECLVSMLV